MTLLSTVVAGLTRLVGAVCLRMTDYWSVSEQPFTLAGRWLHTFATTVALAGVLARLGAVAGHVISLATTIKTH